MWCEVMCKEYNVKPFPYAFCEGCMLNGCYPWSDSPLLVCDYFGGILPRILVMEDKEVKQCASYSLVTEDNWKAHLEDCKSTSKWNEEMRKRAVDGEVHSNIKLPGDEEVIEE